MRSEGRSQYNVSPLARRISLITFLSGAILMVGTAGYRVVSGGTATWLDSLYMTVITVLTIGYGEIVDMANNPAGRVFTMVIAFCGIAVVGYALSSVTAFAVGGELRNEWRRWIMQKKLQSLSGHYIVCGWNALADYIVEELCATGRRTVVVSLKTPDSDTIESDAVYFVNGDPCDEDVIRQAGAEHAEGVFAADENDPFNIVICMTARQLNPALRIVALASDANNEPKLRKAGADAVVSALKIGGLRMASEMVRPAAVSFLDVMLRDREQGLRIEEVAVGKKGEGRPLGDFRSSEWADTLVVAVRDGAEWVFNPPPSFALRTGQRVVIMANPQARQRLQEAVGN